MQILIKLLILSMGFIACTFTNEKIQDVQTYKQSELTLSNKVDPICDMAVSVGHLADTTIYKSKIYGFCSPVCKEQFLEDPEKYILK